MADPAAERQAADAGAADDPRRRRETSLVCGGVDFAPEAAPADAHGARGGIHLDRFHRREVEYDAVVAGPETAAVVAASANREQKIVAARERDRGRDILGARAAREQRGAAVDHRVVDGARLVISRVFGPYQLPRAVE